MKKILNMEKQQLLLELLKAIAVGSFLFFFYFAFKKAMEIGNSLEKYLGEKKYELRKKYKKDLLYKMIWKFFSFSSFNENELITYLEEDVILTHPFLSNLIPLSELDPNN